MRVDHRQEFFSLSDSIQGVLWMILTAVVWSFVGVFSKICLAGGAEPVEVAFFRSVFGFSAFYLYDLCTSTEEVSLRDRVLLTLFGMWGIGIYYSLVQYTISLAGAAMDIILEYTAPFWVALFARFLFGEVLRLEKVLSICIASVGTFCVCLSGGSLPEKAPVLGIVTGLLTGLCYATHFPWTRFWQKKYPSRVIFTWMLAGGTLALGLGAELGIPVHYTHPPSVWGALVSMGVVGTFAAFLCYGKALRYVGLVQAAITLELEPVLSFVWLWFFFGEAFSPVGWFGSFLIICSVLLLSLWRRQ